MTITITFHGLCGVAKLSSGYDVFLHPGHSAGHHSGGMGTHVAHEASLLVAIDQLDTTNWKDELWQPTHIATNETGAQVGVWKIPHNSFLTLSLSNAKKPGGSQYGEAIALPGYHTENPAALEFKKAVQRIAGLSVVSLPDGDWSVSRTNVYDVWQDGKILAKKKTLATGLRWTANADSAALVGAGVKSVSAAGNVDLVFTNIARVPLKEGLAHIEHYYELLDKAVATPLELKDATADLPVWDCVPPTLLF